MENLYKKMFKSTSNVESENITTIDKRLAEDEKSPEKELSLSITNEKKANKIFILHENFRIRAERCSSFFK